MSSNGNSLVRPINLIPHDHLREERGAAWKEFALSLGVNLGRSTQISWFIFQSLKFNEHFAPFASIDVLSRSQPQILS